MSQAVSVPREELAALAAIVPIEERMRLRVWLDVLSRYLAAGDKAAAIDHLVAEYTGRVKISGATIYRNLDAWRALGWTALLRKRWRNAYLAEAQPADDFLEFVAQLWKPLCERSQRCTAAAYRSLFHDYLGAGKLIKGYKADWRGIWRAEHKGMQVPARCPYKPGVRNAHPRGWSQRNLYRLAPDRYERTAARIGMGAAGDYLPKIPTTRVGLPFGRVLVIDDMFHDVKVRLLGNREPQIVVELRALELLTGSCYAWGCKPVREREDGTREHLRETFMRYLIAEVFCRRGYCPDGVLICGEHGTARLPAPLMATLHRWGGDSIVFDAGAIVDTPLTKGLFSGRGRGNFRFKAALESAWNLLKNDLALLPGQKGADPAHAPEDLPNRVRHDKALMRICHAMIAERPQLVEQLRGVFPPYHQYAEAIGLVYDRIENRHDHHLEGFEECGFVKSMWRAGRKDLWKPESMLDEMSPESAEHIRALIRSDPKQHSDLQVMSPAEAADYCRERSQLVRFPDAAVPEILGPELGDVERVQEDDAIYIADKYIPNKRYQVAPIVLTIDGRKQLLPRGSTWLVHINPFDGRQAYISTPDQRFVGVAPVLVAGSRIDTDALRRNLGILSAVRARETKRLTPIAEQRLQELHDNAAHDIAAITGTDPIADAAEAAQEADIAAQSNITRTHARAYDERPRKTGFAW